MVMGNSFPANQTNRGVTGLWSFLSIIPNPLSLLQHRIDLPMQKIQATETVVVLRSVFLFHIFLSQTLRNGYSPSVGGAGRLSSHIADLRQVSLQVTGDQVHKAFDLRAFPFFTLTEFDQQQIGHPMCRVACRFRIQKQGTRPTGENIFDRSSHLMSG